MTPPLRALIIPSWYPGPGQPTAGVFVREQVRALAGAADVAVLYVGPAADAAADGVHQEDGVTVSRTSLRGSTLLDRFFGYIRAGREAYRAIENAWGKPDIVHVQALWPAALIARDIRRRHGIPYVITEHSEEYSAASRRRLVRTPGMLPLVLRPLARAASRTIAVSRFLADRLVALGLASDPAVIPNVVPMSEPAPVATATPHVMLHVSIMGPAKDIAGLLRAVALLRERRDDFVLRLVGDGELRAGLEAQAAALGLGDAVEFVGRRSPKELRDFRAGSAFTVVSSLHETFSVVAAESLMSGRPVLSTRCGGPEEFVTPEVGRLVPAGDPVALCEGLDWMLDHHTEFDPRALHDYARERFAPDVVAGRILAVYEEVLGG